MNNFPKLKNDEVVLSIAEVNTGVVLDENFKHADSRSQGGYRIFENLDEALLVAQKIITERKDIECYIHGKDNKLLHFLEHGKGD